MMPHYKNGTPGEESASLLDASEPRLRFHASRCLPARTHYSDCRACQDACPGKAIAVREDGPALVDACIGCGQCAAACPTDALRVAGFPDLPEPGRDTPAVTSLECWRVPETLLDENALRVPCTGGMETGQLLALNRLAGAGGLTLVDRGWCSGCHANSGEHHPAGTVLAHTRRLLEQAVTPAVSPPRLEKRPTPPALAHPGIPSPEMQRSTGRRAFFHLMGGHAAAARHATQSALGTSATRALIDKHLPPRRSRLHRELAHCFGAQTVPAIRPRLQVTSDCDGHGICAAICPTGALRRESSGTVDRLLLDAGACIACGLCERACPEKAMHLIAHEGGDEQVELNQLEERECPDCGRSFISRHADDDICHPCRKSRRFAAAGFAFFARNPAAGPDQQPGGGS